MNKVGVNCTFSRDTQTCHKMANIKCTDKILTSTILTFPTQALLSGTKKFSSLRKTIVHTGQLHNTEVSLVILLVIWSKLKHTKLKHTNLRVSGESCILTLHVWALLHSHNSVESKEESTNTCNTAQEDAPWRPRNHQDTVETKTKMLLRVYMVIIKCKTEEGYLICSVLLK